MQEMGMRRSQLLLLAFAFGFFIGTLMFGMSVSDNNYVSKCYTNLQPSEHFINGWEMFMNWSDNSLKLYNLGENFTTRLVTASGSMRPTISDFSTLVEVQPTKDNLHVGDIIAFDCGNRSFVHRLMQMELRNGTLFYITKGDNNAQDDTAGLGCTSRFENITAKVVGVLY